MRLLLIIVLGLFLMTYTWGWLVHVPSGLMDTKTYTTYYWRETNDQTHFFFETTRQALRKQSRRLDFVRI